MSSSDNHFIRASLGTRQDTAETDAGVDEAVVTFRNLEFLAVIGDGLEGRSGGDEGAAVRPGTDVLGKRFVKTRGIGKGEDDWAVDMLGHFADDFFGECSGDGGSSD